MTVQHFYPVEIQERLSGGFEARCPTLGLKAQGLTRELAEGRLLVLVYRAVADRIAAGTGDVPLETGNVFLCALVSVCRKALDGSEDEKDYAKELCEAIAPELATEKMLSPADILEYDPESKMPASQRIGLVLAALSPQPENLN